MACVRTLGFSFRLAIANNIRHYSICHRLNAKLIPATPTVMFSRNIRGRLKPTIDRNESSEIMENPEESQESSTFVPSKYGVSADIEKTEEESKTVEEVLNKIHIFKDTLTSDSILYYLRSIKHFYRFKETNLSLNEILNSEEFLLLMRTCQKHLGRMHPDHIVQILVILRELEIPDRAVIVQQMLRLLKEDFNNLSFRESTFLYRYVKYTKNNSDASAIKLALEESLPLKFRETFDRDSEVDVKEALNLLSASSHILSPCATEICHAAIHMCETKGDEFIQAVIGTLLKDLKFADKNDLRYPRISSITFNILKKVALMDLRVKKMFSFLLRYAYLVRHGFMDYDRIIADNLGKKAIESDELPARKLIITTAFNEMHHSNIEIADYFVDLILKDESVLIGQSHPHQIIRFLHNSNYHNLRREKWEKMKPIIKKLPTLTDKSLWDNLTVIDFAMDLVAMDIFPDYILKILSEKYNNPKIVKEDWATIKKLIALNEAVALWHPEFHKNLLSKDTIADIKEFYMQKLKSPSNFQLQIKKALEAATYMKDFVVFNCYSPKGFILHEVVLLNRKNEPISLAGLQNEKPMPVEVLKKRVQSEKVITFVNFAGKSYCINSHNLFSPASVTLKALESRGFFVVPIIEDEWFELEEMERGLYLWKCVQEKFPDSWKYTPSKIDKVTDMAGKIKDTIVSNARKISNFSNFFRNR